MAGSITFCLKEKAKEFLRRLYWEPGHNIKEQNRKEGFGQGGRKAGQMKMEMKKAVKAAVMIMAVTGITAVPAMPALAEAGGSGGFPEKWEEVSVGASLKDIYTDKSMYSPGEPVTVTVEMNSHKVTGEETLRLQIRHLDTVVWEQERQLSPGSSAGHFVASLPGEDFQGYAAEAYLVGRDGVLDYRMTGIDVSSDWNRFPRYGYITKLDHRTDAEIAATLTRLKNHHINGLFYYDVFDSQDKPLAGTVERPDGEWKSLAKQTVDAASLQKTIAVGHSLNMRSFFYNLIFGAYDGYGDRGISPEWGLYKDERHQEQDSHDLGGDGWETPKLWMFNPANQKLQMNFLNFPYFSRLFKPYTVNCYVFSLVFALMGSLQGKVFLNVSNRCPLLYPRA